MLTSRKRSGAPSGIVMVYTLIIIVVLIALASFGVDYGRVQVAKGELQVAAIAAARGGVQGLQSSASQGQSNAIGIAAANTCDGQPVALSNSEIEFGTWDSSTKTFTVLTGAAANGANAVRVHSRKTINLTFARVVGANTCDVTATAIAMGQANRPVGIIGLNSVSFVQSSMADSYNSSGAATSGANAPVLSNGDISFTSSQTVSGYGRPGPGHSVTAGASNFSGSTAPATTNISAPAPSSGTYSATINDNANIPAGYVSGGNFTLTGGSVTIPAGNYYFTDFSMSGGSTLNVSGKVNIYIAGTLSMSQSAQTGSHAPGNLNFTVLSSNTVNLINSNDVRMNLYAPLADVVIGNSKQVYGSVLGKTLSVSNSVKMHFDEALLGNAAVGSAIQLVQ